MIYINYYSQVELLSQLQKVQEMNLQRFLVLRDVENNILKVYQNPPIRNLLNWGRGGKGDILRY